MKDGVCENCITNTTSAFDTGPNDINNMNISNNNTGADSAADNNDNDNTSDSCKDGASKSNLDPQAGDRSVTKHEYNR